MKSNQKCESKWPNDISGSICVTFSSHRLRVLYQQKAFSLFEHVYTNTKWTRKNRETHKRNKQKSRQANKNTSKSICLWSMWFFHLQLRWNGLRADERVCVWNTMNREHECEIANDGYLRFWRMILEQLKISTGDSFVLQFFHLCVLVFVCVRSDALIKAAITFVKLLELPHPALKTLL